MKNHFIHISDYSQEQIWEILNLAKELKTKFHNKEDYFHFKNLAISFSVKPICIKLFQM